MSNAGLWTLVGIALVAGGCLVQPAEDGEDVATQSRALVQSRDPVTGQPITPAAVVTTSRARAANPAGGPTPDPWHEQATGGPTPDPWDPTAPSGNSGNAAPSSDHSGH